PLGGAHSSLELGPRTGSAAKAARMGDDKRRVTLGPHPGHPGHPLKPRKLYFSQQSNCVPVAPGCAYFEPAELCPTWILRDGDPLGRAVSLDCPQPLKLNPGKRR
ncbi:MAG TPA: hypothetical protein VGV09_13555, partial [Steroidobacteraceae bacterium]|nr:hypothetical protein [Steroidobacteraceae bacterium]